jgi:hypothetical protein
MGIIYDKFTELTKNENNKKIIEIGEYILQDKEIYLKYIAETATNRNSLIENLVEAREDFYQIEKILKL